MLCLNFVDKTVHAPFFVPLFESLRNVTDPKDLNEPMRLFLESAEVVARTDDDKTLILATRLNGDGSIL